MRLRFKVQTIRTALWLGIGLGFLGIVYLLVTMYMKGPKKMWPYLDSKNIEEIVKAAKGSIKQETDDEAASHESYAQLWKLNVTGKVEALATANTEVEDVKPAIQPLGEVIDVVMIIAPVAVDVQYKDAAAAGTATQPLSSDPQERHKSQLRDSHLEVGSKLRPPYDAAPYEGKVLQITADEVLFHWGGEEVPLRVAKLADIVDSAKLLPASPAGPEVPADVVEAPVDDGIDRTESRSLGEDGWYIGTTEQAKIRSEHETLLAEISIGTQYLKDLRRQCIRLETVPAESLAAQRGFEEGDVILSINGRAIVSKASAINYFKDSPDLQTYRVELDRKGKKITKTFKTR